VVKVLENVKGNQNARQSGVANSNFPDEPMGLTSADLGFAFLPEVFEASGTSNEH
jgi:hypothetical protein